MEMEIRALNAHEIMRFEAAEASELNQKEKLDSQALREEGKWILASHEYADLPLD